MSESSVGKSITCPACKRSVLVPAADAPSTSTPGQNYVPQPSAPSQLCPRCNAGMQPGAIVCTVCGFDTQSGRFVIGDLGSRSKFNIAAYVGPIAALLVLAFGGRYIYEAVSTPLPEATEEKRGKSRRSTKARVTNSKPVKSRGKEEERELGIDRSPSTNLFMGGTVDSVMSLSDTLKPYSLNASVSVLPGGFLVVEQGVTLTGAEGVTITVAGGDFMVRGVNGNPAIIALPVSAVGPGGDVSASYAIFADTAMLSDANTVAIDHATFARGLRLQPKAPENMTEWKIEFCDFYPFENAGDPCLDVRDGIPRRLLTLRLRRGNFLGKVTGVVRATAALDLVRSYWEGGPEAALAEFIQEGQVSFEPISSHRIHEAGGCSPTDLRKLLSPLGAMMVPMAREHVLRNTELGFELEFPENWKMAGSSMLVPPSKYTRARVRFEWQEGEKLVVRLKSRWLVKLQGSGVTDLNADHGTPIEVNGVDALDFTCTFAAGGERWANRVVVVPTSTGSYSISLYAREDQLRDLGPDFMKIVERFTVLGAR